jgi:site-specific DNA-methyltransferase (cytosine-N4-specific)
MPITDSVSEPLGTYSTGLARSAVLQGEAEVVLKRLPDGFFRCCVTSPPYWGLRDYEADGQIGADDDPHQYIDHLVAVFEQVRRVLAEDGTLWLNIGDSYTSGGREYRAPDKKNPVRAMSYRAPTPAGLKPKDLVGIPWRLALALQEAGWYLRSDIIWEKPNCMPESVRDRPTRAHEYVFLLTKSLKYHYDYGAARGPNGRNRRTVWSIPTEPFRGAHFATFPPRLVENCILPSTIPGDWVLDQFFGAGTVGDVCKEHNRRYIGIELNPDYVQMAVERIESTQPGLLAHAMEGVS